MALRGTIAPHLRELIDRLEHAKRQRRMETAPARAERSALRRRERSLKVRLATAERALSKYRGVLNVGNDLLRHMPGFSERLQLAGSLGAELAEVAAAITRLNENIGDA